MPSAVMVRRLHPVVYPRNSLADPANTAAGAPLGAVFGNLISGFVASYTSWKWVFGVIAIMAAAITIASIAIIPPPKHTLHEEGATIRGSVDWIGAFLITAGLLALLFGLTEGNVVGWSTPWIPVLIVVSVILVALFVFWQGHLEKSGTRAPIMKVSIFKSKRFSAAMMTMALFFSSFNGFLVYATFFYQDYQGLSALQTTLRFIPTGVVGVLTAAVVSQLLSVVPAYAMLAFGNLCVSISCLLFAIPIPSDTIYWATGFPAMVLSVFGADVAWPCLTGYRLGAGGMGYWPGSRDSHPDSRHGAGTGGWGAGRGACRAVGGSVVARSSRRRMVELCVGNMRPGRCALCLSRVGHSWEDSRSEVGLSRRKREGGERRGKTGRQGPCKVQDIRFSTAGAWLVVVGWGPP
jgi:predicted MFS family arabinose efflux permease